MSVQARGLGTRRKKVQSETARTKRASARRGIRNHVVFANIEKKGSNSVMHSIRRQVMLIVWHFHDHSQLEGCRALLRVA